MSALVVAACGAPFAWLLWQAATGGLGTNPIEALTHETGQWTIRLLLASLAVSGPNAAAGVTIALVHTLFNLTGTAIVYPFQPIRRLPLMAAERLAEGNPSLGVTIFFASPQRTWPLVSRIQTPAHRQESASHSSLTWGQAVDLPLLLSAYFASRCGA